MYILPYYIETFSQSSKLSFQTLWLFLSKQGNAVWETDEKGAVDPEIVVRDYLQPNGFHGTIKCVKDNALYFEVDKTKTNVQNFYNWIDDEAEEETDVWRPFFWIADELNEAWGWKEEAQQLTLGSFGSIDRVWDVVLAV